MTVPFPLDAFENARTLTLSRPRRTLDHSKLVSVGITAAIHVLIVAAALTAVHVSHTKVMQELSVQITPEKLKPAEELAPPPKMIAPAQITVPPPEVSIQTTTPPPVVAQQSISKPTPAAPVTAAPSPVG